MRSPTVEELRAISAFFQSAAPQYGLYDHRAKQLKPLAVEHGLYKKNLEMLMSLVDKGKIDLRSFEQTCRICRREKRQVQWVSEVMPAGLVEGEVMARNLMGEGGHVHRLLVSITPPLSSLPIGATTSVLTDPGQVRMREMFTVDDLVEHFCNTFAVARTRDIDKTFSGAFNYLLSFNSLDAILFAMDYAAFDENYLRNPLELQDHYLPQAVEELRNRKARL